MNAYSESYLADAQETLGEALDYAVNDCGYHVDGFFGWFIASGVAAQFAHGNPRYVAGVSGPELVRIVVAKVHEEWIEVVPSAGIDRSQEYWAGWIMAYYQWLRACSFDDMVNAGLFPSAVARLHLLHEADESKFVAVADEMLAEWRGSFSPLAQARRRRGLTQRELAEAADVSLRMVQLYEQGQNDLAKAQAAVVLRLAHVLGCGAESLIWTDNNL